MEAPIARAVNDGGNSASDAALAKAQELRVVKLAEMLGKEGKGEDMGPAQHLKGLFAAEVANQDVVLILPGLDIQVSESATAATLPNVGESSAQSNGSLPSSLQSGGDPSQRPAMAASVLTSATKDAAEAEQEVAQSLGNTTSWTKSTVPFAPSALVNNISGSFSRLVDSRMKAWTLLLLRHSLSTGDGSSRKRLLGVLGASLKVESATTKFRTLPLPDSAKGHHKEAEVILPLLFEAKLVIEGKDKLSEAVTLRAPGTVAADFIKTPTGSALKEVKVQLDCNSLLTAMVEQARMLVLKAVASSTKTQVPSSGSSMNLKGSAAVSGQPYQQQQNSQLQPPQPQDDTKTDENPALPSTLLSASKSLASFRSALDLSNNPAQADRSPGLKKATKSALRLNSILQGNNEQSASPGASALGIRKTRSVRWNTPGEIPVLNSKETSVPSPKKNRSTAGNWTAAKLKSFKSFGRPHAGDFGSGPRNATFGEFGGRPGSWGMDGRMSAHPTPLQDATLVDPLSGEVTKAEKNATFNIATSRPMTSSAPRPMSSALSNSMSQSRPSMGYGSGKPMQRTATVLETLLRKSMK